MFRVRDRTPCDRDVIAANAESSVASCSTTIALRTGIQRSEINGVRLR